MSEEIRLGWGRANRKGAERADGY